MLGGRLKGETDLMRISEETEAAMLGNALVDDFLLTFRRDIASIRFPDAMPGIQPYLIRLDSVLRESVSSHFAANRGTFSAFWDTAALKEASQRARMNVGRVLHACYLRLSEMLFSKSVEAFRIATVRLPVTPGLPSNLGTYRGLAQQDFEGRLVDLNEEFSKLCGAVTSEGMLSDFSHAPLGISEEVQINVKERLPSPRFSHQFQSPFLVNRFKQALKQRSDETVTASFLDGQYNPYVRTARYPPTHLNINYLLDPRGFVVDREFNELYDEKNTGPVMNRADGMVFPGVASVPFDPTDHPIPKDYQPWWAKVAEYFTSDDDGN